MCSIRKLSGTRPRSLCAFASGGPSVLSSTELYDTVTNTFAVSTPAMNYISASATAALLPNGKVLITDWLSNTTELYNSTIDTLRGLDPGDKYLSYSCHRDAAAQWQGAHRRRRHRLDSRQRELIEIGLAAQKFDSPVRSGGERCHNLRHNSAHLI